MKKLILFLFLALSVAMLFSQEKRPKIGLVLSGGGAKGLAHIGVLKEIDKAGLKIDYIGGTSMGAIVGGIYAAGYSAEQIEKIVKNVDFPKLLQDKFPRNALPFFEKEFGEEHAFTLPVNKGGVQLPKAISKGQNILDLLTYLLAPVDTIQDFSKLPIPFFCIGTNVENGEEVLLEKGFLPLALRASGSFPTLLDPVEVDDLLLIDGGVANNFPVDVMKRKGVDYIIGVDVQSNLSKRKKLNSAVAILNQIVSYDVYRERADKLLLTDSYIKPDIEEFTVVDFEKGSELIRKGEEAGKNFKAVFDSLVKTQSSTQPRKLIKYDDKPVYLNFVEVKGSKIYTPAYVRGKLNIQVGDSITRRDIKKKMDFLTATSNYERVDYRLIKKKDKNTLIINVKESDQTANLRLGVHYDLLYESALLANYNHKGFLKKNDQLSVDIILGDNIRYNLNYFVDNGFYTSYGFRSRYNHFRTNTPFNNEDPSVNEINLKYSDFTNELFVQTRFDRKFAIGLGAELKNIRVSTETLTDNNNELFFDNSTYFNFHGYLKLDTYDDKYFVTKGFYADLGGRWYISSTDFNNNFTPFLQLQGTVGFATTFWDRLTFQYTNDAGFSFDNPSSDVFDFYLGGYNQNYINTFVRFYGYDFASLAGNSFLRSEFLFRYKLFKNNYVNFLANYARVDDNVFNDTNIFEDIMSGYALGYSVNTLIGPVEIKYSWSPDNQKHFWLFNLGFWF